MADAAGWLDSTGDGLVGRSAQDARAEVESAGLRVRTAEPGAVLTLEYRPDRVTLLLDDAGRVASVRAG